MKKTVKGDVLALGTRDTDVSALGTHDTDVSSRCAGGLRSSSMVVRRRRFETTYRSHLQGPSSPTTNQLHVKSLKSEGPSLMEIFSFV